MSIQQTISGEKYDWTLTKKPERPWIHQYHQTLVDKLFMARKGNPKTGQPPQVYYTFETALERIRKINEITRGIPKITYLVGWQFDGHDSKYPDWSVVNPRLKRPQDAAALDSLRWIMDEALKYNTTVSIHINMLDAYKNSPLWQTYVDHDLIVKMDTGEFHNREYAIYDGEPAYTIDYAKEWDSGLACKRIDQLLEMLPIKRQGTIHIDAFLIADRTNPDLQRPAMRKILRYWRNMGVDVTSESLFHSRHGEAFIGLQPMAWLVNVRPWGYSLQYPEISQETWFRLPPDLTCVCFDDLGFQAGQLYGVSMLGEQIKSPDDFRKPFYLQTVPWYFLNRLKRLRVEFEEFRSALYCSDGVISRVENNRRTIRQNERILVDGDDMCLPALWRRNQELVAYSAEGYSQRVWDLPPDWKAVSKADIYLISSESPKYLKTVDIKDGRLTLSLDRDQAVSVVPAGTDVAVLQKNGFSSRS